MSSEYATLEEAFGIASFLAPEPPILRGDVGQVQDARQKNLDAEIKQLSKFQEPKETVSGQTRQPLETSRKQLVSNSAKCLQKAHASGGAAAAWAMVPKHLRAGMMWHAVKEAVSSDFVVMVLMGLALLMLMK